MRTTKQDGKRCHPRKGHDGRFSGSSSRVDSPKASGGSQSLEEDELGRSTDRELKAGAESEGPNSDHCGCCEDRYHEIPCGQWEGRRTHKESIS